MDSTSDGRYDLWPERRIVVVADATFDAVSSDSWRSDALLLLPLSAVSTLQCTIIFSYSYTSCVERPSLAQPIGSVICISRTPQTGVEHRGHTPVTQAKDSA
jgi:hypothetical protein